MEGECVDDGIPFIDTCWYRSDGTFLIHCASLVQNYGYLTSWRLFIVRCECKHVWSTVQVAPLTFKQSQQRWAPADPNDPEQEVYLIISDFSSCLNRIRSFRFRGPKCLVLLCLCASIYLYPSIYLSSVSNLCNLSIYVFVFPFTVVCQQNEKTSFISFWVFFLSNIQFSQVKAPQSDYREVRNQCVYWRMIAFIFSSLIIFFILCKCFSYLSCRDWEKMLISYKVTVFLNYGFSCWLFSKTTIVW